MSSVEGQTNLQGDTYLFSGVSSHGHKDKDALRPEVNQLETGRAERVNSIKLKKQGLRSTPSLSPQA